MSSRLFNEPPKVDGKAQHETFVTYMYIRIFFSTVHSQLCTARVFACEFSTHALVVRATYIVHAGARTCQKLVDLFIYLFIYYI